MSTSPAASRQHPVAAPESRPADERPAAGRPVPAAASRILVVDDEPSMREMLGILLRRDGHDVTIAESGREAIDLIRRESFDLVVSDVKMPDVSGVEVIRAARAVNPGIIAILITAYGSRELIAEVGELGVDDYVEKPFNVEVLKFRIRKELERRRLRQENVLLKRTLQNSHQFSNIIGSSNPMLAVFRLVEMIAPTSSTVLISGESGTGKELVARAIHFNSPRKDRPFVALNCGALSETLLDSELFGHMRGAFTGADTNKKGLIEVAEKGTIFLDEIGEMTPLVQVKVLRVLQERKFRRLGGTDEVNADIRILAATNRDLDKMVAEGTFREDLFYRINVIPLRLPPLRERREDIPQLASHFVTKFTTQMGKDITGISGVRHGAADRLRLARQHPRTGKRHRAGRGARANPHDPARQPARVAARDGGRCRGWPRARRSVSPGRVRPGEPRPAHRARVHRRSAAPHRRRQGQGSRAARNELPFFPGLYEEIQPQVGASGFRLQA